MAADYASERRAAGRTVPADVALRSWREHGEPRMKLFDPHIHMTSRTTDDYEAMAQAGIAAIVEPAFWLGQPRTHVGTFEDYFRRCSAGSASARASSASATSARWPSTRRRRTTRGVADGVLELLPRYLEKDGVVAVGEIGYDDQTPAEDEVLRAPSSSWRASSTCRSSSTPPTATRSAAPSGRLALVKESASPRSACSSTTTTRRRCRSCSTRAAGPATRSTRTRRWTRRAWWRW